MPRPAASPAPGAPARAGTEPSEGTEPTRPPGAAAPAAQRCTPDTGGRSCPLFNEHLSAGTFCTDPRRVYCQNSPAGEVEGWRGSLPAPLPAPDSRARQTKDFISPPGRPARAARGDAGRTAGCRPTPGAALPRGRSR